MDYRFIKNKQKLKKLCEELSKEKVIAIDIECENNLHHYGSYISIIQISAGQKNWVVDVLELKEINELKEILEDKNIQKIFHDVSFDLRILNFEFNIQPKNLFDTQIAALLIGERNVGLASLLEKYFSIKKESKFQMADWTIRPINTEMISYAVKDTAYLIRLKEILEQKIKELGREEWLKQELEYLEKKDYEHKEPVFEDIKGISSLSPKEKSLAKKLYVEREKIAKSLDKPSYKILSNRRIMEFANSLLQEQDLNKIKKMHFKLKEKLPLIIGQINKEEITIEPKQKKERKNYTETQKRQLQELEDVRVKLGKTLDLEPYLIMSKDQVHDVVRNKNYDSLREWQKELIIQETKLFL